VERKEGGEEIILHKEENRREELENKEGGLREE
jgi:hypothetical protein